MGDSAIRQAVAKARNKGESVASIGGKRWQFAGEGKYRRFTPAP